MSRRTGGRPADILMWGVWPDPRAGGICAVVHDLVKRLNELGRNVIVASDALGLPSLGAERLFVMWVPGDRPFDWQDAAARGRIYAGFDHLAQADRLGAIGGVAERLARVGIIHYHGDDFVDDDRPVAGNGSGHGCAGGLPASRKRIRPDRLDAVAGAIAARSGRRPRIVRTRHDDVQGGLDVFMRLTGIDPMTRFVPERRALLDGAIDLGPIVREHVGRHRAELVAEGWSDAQLDCAVEHVWYFLNFWRISRRELHELDAVVCLTQRAARELAALLGVNGTDGGGANGNHNSSGDCDNGRPRRRTQLVSIANGSSFEPRSWRQVEDLVRGYCSAPGLVCHRGAAPHAERVHLRPDDRIVVFVGRCDRSKGIHELAGALRRLNCEETTGHPRVRVRGIFVGDFHPQARRDLAAIDPQRAGDYLLFTGRVTDPDILASLYVLGHVTALVSYADAFGLVGLESYLMGTPCVVSEGTSMAEVYLEKPSCEGNLIALGVARPRRTGTHRFFGVDVDSLVHQLAAVIHGEPLARRMAESGGSYMRKHHTYRRMGDDYQALYDQLLDAAESSPSNPGSPWPPLER
jgi:glycosyltransferase involved in cell wall biosynthesis